MICRLCGKDRKLIKAHIVPEAFFRLLSEDWRAPELLTNVKGEFPKKAPIGIYDREILCEECEKLFGSWDQYVVELLLQSLSSFTEMKERGNTVALTLKDFDYPKLKMFLISVAWRASVATNNFFKRVSLGSWEEKAKSRILDSDPGGEQDFGALMSIFKSSDNLKQLANSVMDPFRERWNGVNAYRFYFGRFCAYIKVDRRPFPEQFARVLLSPNRPLHLVVRNFEKSNDLKSLLAVVMGGRK